MNYQGFQIIDDFGNIQIMDEAYDLTWSKYHTLSSEQIDISGDFLVIDPNNGSSIEFRPYFFAFTGGGDEASAGSNPNQLQRFYGSGKVHEFSYAMTGNRSNYGFEVFDEVGSVVFSSSFRSIDVLGEYITNNVDTEMQKNGNRLITKVFVGGGDIGISLLAVPLTARKNNKGNWDAYTISVHREGQYIAVYEKMTYTDWIPSFLGFRYDNYRGLHFLILSLKEV